MKSRVRPGCPYPLGATWDGMGVNFALFSENAEKVELCLFDSIGAKAESVRYEMPEYTDQIWHIYLPDVRPGQLYGYRVYGPWDPKAGNRFNHHKVVMDPYARAVLRSIRWDDSMFSYKIGAKEEDLSFDTRDNAAFCPLAAVVDPAFTWGNDMPPQSAWHKTFIYEAHIKGSTMLHPKVPEDVRGTYSGFISDPMIRHLKDLGVTAVELLPVHRKVDDRYLEEKGLSNYWGYNTLCFFAPDERYSVFRGSIAYVNEFKTLVRNLHAAGIEVILDVVYNHTAEGNHMGPTFSFRGIDNRAYYRLTDSDPRYYMDFTGCGNTLNMRHPAVLRLIMDSLRYWALEMRVDGFRFDLASALARELYEVNQLSSFFNIIHQDPVLSQVKLIAEPWDVGEGGYQVGNFPVLWTEWNGNYRDTVRSFIKGDSGYLRDFATRLTGSSDLYGSSERRPYASINFITCHDGFTLHDLVSYNEKHNEANGEDNNDGANDNRSWNCGVEGPTDDPEIRALRMRQKRNFIATLFLSAGVPMLNAGDELGKTQQGNNNAYCQDNELSWMNWELGPDEVAFMKFVRRVARKRHGEPVFERRKFYTGEPSAVTGIRDITWYSPAGTEMGENDWFSDSRCIQAVLAGDGIDEMGEDGGRVSGNTFLILFNMHFDDVPFTLPEHAGGEQGWKREFDTFEEKPFTEHPLVPPGSTYTVRNRSVVLFTLEAEE